MMRWLGPMLHLIYPPTPVREFADLLTERQVHVASLSESRRRLQDLAGEPVDAVLHEIIKDL